MVDLANPRDDGQPRRAPSPAPNAPAPRTIKLPLALRGAEEIFQYLITTSERAYQLSQRYVELGEEQVRILAEIRDEIRGEIKSLKELGEPETKP